MNKMKEDYELTKQKENHLSEEVERLKKKLTCQELISLTNKPQTPFNYSKQNKENEDQTPISYYNPNLGRNVNDLIETANIVLTPLQVNNPEISINTSNYKLSLNHKYNSSGQIGISTKQIENTYETFFLNFLIP